ncbi:MAG: hypothetical protein KAK02_06300 [Desulfobulbaceae bacterium]|nr:hypothetical protein [Desulfobulbaceae bacterium]
MGKNRIVGQDEIEAREKGIFPMKYFEKGACELLQLLFVPGCKGVDDRPPFLRGLGVDKTLNASRVILESMFFGVFEQQGGCLFFFVEYPLKRQVMLANIQVLGYGCEGDDYQPGGKKRLKFDVHTCWGVSSELLPVP